MAINKPMWEQFNFNPFFPCFFYIFVQTQFFLMDTKKDKLNFFRKLRHMYRLSIYRDATFEEVLNLRLSRLNVIAWGGSFILLLLIGVISIIVYTPVREFIPGYPDENTLRNSIANKERLDSLENELGRRDLYIDNLNRIISGQEPANYENMSDTSRDYNDIQFTRSLEDSILREKIRNENKLGISGNPVNKMEGISQIQFFAPVKGLVTNSFNAVADHYGTDIVTVANEIVKSTLEGTVIIATWTLETGWVIQIQHQNNLISVYKHNAELLKRVGDFVKVGEAIAIVGNSGELTTGPHLHFELWYNGVPINPEDYISF